MESGQLQQSHGTTDTFLCRDIDAGPAWRGRRFEHQLGLAWLYVGLRVAHSLVHALINVVMFRFAIFMAASFVLLAITLRAAMIVY